MKVSGIRQQGSIYSESPSRMFLSLQYEQKIFFDKHMAINVAVFFFSFLFLLKSMWQYSVLNPFK